MVHIRSFAPSVPIVVGGVHPSVFDGHCLANGADFVIRGEADSSLPALAEVLERGGDFHSVRGLSFKENGQFVKTAPPARLSCQQMERLPVPAYDLIPAGKYSAVPVQTSRGCKHACAFCSISHRGSWRQVEPMRAVDLLQAALTYSDRFTTSGAVYFVDDCFTTDGHWALTVLNEISQRDLDPFIGVEARADQLTDSVVKAMAQHRLWLIQVGIESGYQHGLTRVRKGITLNDAQTAAAMLKEHGVSQCSVFSFIVGLPWETLDDCVQTIRYAHHLSTTYGVGISMSWYEPFPGSAIWHSRNEFGAGVGPEAFDGPGDWRTNIDLFRLFRPNMSMEDCLRVEELIHSYAVVVPRHLGLFQYRVTEDLICGNITGNSTRAAMASVSAQGRCPHS